MTLNLNIEYRTTWGEEIVLCVGSKRYALIYKGEGLWSVEIPKFTFRKGIEYTYEVVCNGVTVRKEWKKHTLSLAGCSAPKVLTINDRWNDRPSDAPLYSSAFTKAIFGRETGAASSDCGAANVLFQVSVANVRPGETLALAASSKELGAWSRVIPFDDSAYPQWSLPLTVTEPFAYKIVVADKDTLAPLAWEEGENRWFGVLPQKGELVVEADAQPVFIGRNWRGAGTAIPVFSLRSEDDFGVGEFYDLKKMVDWAASTGQGTLQLLPINDTTMTGTYSDSYPYNPNSTFALHPQYIHLPAAGVKVDQEYKTLQAKLDNFDTLDYEQVNSLKLSLLRKAFAANFKDLSATDEYKAFIEKNESWLIPYAAFCVLRDLNSTSDFTKWKGYAKYSRKKVAAFCVEHQQDIDFWCFVQ